MAPVGFEMTEVCHVDNIRQAVWVGCRPFMPVTLSDGVNALAVAEAATESARTGRTVEL
jgi:predicted dehydrogenase